MMMMGEMLCCVQVLMLRRRRRDSTSQVIAKICEAAGRLQAEVRQRSPTLAVDVFRYRVQSFSECGNKKICH